MHFTPAEADRIRTKEGTTMKNSISKKTAYAGAGAGLVLFALFGLMPGSLMGGVAGINIAGWLFGLPLEPGLISRVIVLVSMLAGVMVSGVGIVTATSTFGWIIGRALEGMVREKAPAGESETYVTAEQRREAETLSNGKRRRKIAAFFGPILNNAFLFSLLDST